MGNLLGIWSRFYSSLFVVFTFIASCLAADSQQPDTRANWSSMDVGKVALEGGYEIQGDVLKVQGAGADIWREADSFHYIYVPWEGDGEVIARVLSVENTDPWAKAGIMFREDLSDTSRHAMVAMTPAKGAAFLRRYEPANATLDDSHQAMRIVPGERQSGFQQRGSAGADKAEGAIVSSRSPRWIKLVRRGDLFIAYDSADGSVWEWLGTDRIAMRRTIYVGIGVTSHDHAKLCAAYFDQIRFLALSDSQWPVQLSLNGKGSGLAGSYFNSRDHSGSAKERVDSTIDFDWAAGAPMEGINADGFTVRWEGELEAPTSDPYSLQVVSDDRVRLWLNGELIIDEWYEHGEAKSAAMVNLEQGKRYLIRLDFFENRGRALVKLLWNSPSIPLQIIPASQLYPSVTDEDSDGLPDLWELAEGLNPKNDQDALAVPSGGKVNHRQRYKQRYATTLRREAKSDLPKPWLRQDVGRVGQGGAAALSDGVWTVDGSGVDIWANSDGFHFVYQLWRGNGEIIARVSSQQNTDPWAKAGVMIRESLEAESRHITAALTPENGVILLHRHESGGITTVDSGGPSTGPVWLKLVRQGNVVSGHRSLDGRIWEWIGTEAVDLPEEIYVGLAVNSHDNSALGRVTFDGVAIDRVANSNGRSSPQSGKGDGLRVRYFDSVAGTSVSRVDPQVNFDWGDDAPAAGIGKDQFTARWEGWLQPVSDDLYALHVLSDDGARLWLDGNLLIDAWSDRAATLSIAKVQLKADKRYAIAIEFYDRDREAVMKLLWSTPGIPKQAIPQSQLYTTGQETAVPGTNPTGGQNQGSGNGQGNGNDGEVSLEPSKDSVSQPSFNRADLPEGVTDIANVLEILGSSAVERLGQWEIDGSSIYAVDRRGALEYELSLSAPDLYRLEIEGTSQLEHDFDSGFYLQVWVNGEYLGRTLLDAAPGRTAQTHLLLPYLKARSHRVRIFWDNARKGRSLRLNALRLQVLNGADADGDGIKDWIERKLEEENQVTGVDASDSELITSVISPACIEGTGKYLSMMTITADGQSVPIKKGIGDRWYANVPLKAGEETLLEISFQGGAHVLKKRVLWKTVNPLQSSDFAVRLGDSLLLSAAPEDKSEVGSSEIEIEGVRNVQDGREPVSHRFDQIGQVAVKGTWIAGQSPAESKSIRVNVLNAAFPDRPAIWVGKKRRWHCPDLANEIFIEADSRLKLEEAKGQNSSGRSFKLGTDAPESRTILARVNKGGAILSQTEADGFTVSSALDTDFALVRTLEDGSELIEMGIVMSPVIPQVRLEVGLIAGGVLFEDGTVVKQKTSLDLQPLGLTHVRFIRPAGIHTSVCHKVKALQADTTLGSY